MRLRKAFAVLLVLLVSCALCFAESGDHKININVQEFTLKNGMLFLIVERHTTPQVACRLSIRAGSALEERGKTGIAHLLEHMMFKGTANFGTLDPEKDRELQGRIEAAYQVVLAEERKRHPDREVIKARLAEMERLRLEVQKIYVPQALSSQLGRNGAVGVNAFTSKDQTQYTASVPSDMVEQWFSIMSEQIFEPSWREFYVEKEVVQREWAFRYVNNPNGAAWLDLGSTAYRAHPYANPVIGWKSDMEKYSTTDAAAFHRKYYTPGNAVCVLVGDITPEKARMLAEIYFARYPAGQRAPETVTREPLQQGPRRSIRYLKGARTPIVLLGFHAAPMGSRDFYALDALTMVLSHGRGARLTQEVVEKGLAVSTWAANPDSRYAGMVILGGSPNEPQQGKNGETPHGDQRRAYLGACEGMEKLLLDQVENLKTRPVTEGELKRIRKLNHRDFLDRLRTNEALAGTLATLEVEIGWRYLTTYLERMGEVTPADIRKAAEKYLRAENLSRVYVIPGGEVEQPPEPYAEVRSLGTSASLKVGRPSSFVNHSAYPTPSGWKHPLSFDRKPSKIDYPPAETATLQGTRVFFLADTTLPLIDLTLLVKAGAVDMLPPKAGIAPLLSGTLVRGGTRRFSPAELATILDENAIDLSLTVNEEEAAIRLSVLKEDWEKGLELLEEILLRPRFDSRVVDVVKEQSLIALKRQSGDAHAVAMREGMIWHFKGHPYGRDPLDGLKTIPQLTGEDLRAFLREYFVPANMVACVAGDIEKARVLSSLERFLRALPDKPAPVRKIGDPLTTPPVVSLIHKPGQVQSQVFMVLPAMKRTHPDYWKLALLTSTFGGSDSLMYTRLRDNLGLVYAAGFYQTYKWNAGMLVGIIGCKADKTPEAIQETVEIMRGLRKDVPGDKLEEKRMDALNSFVFNVDTPLDLTEAYGRYTIRKEPMDTLSRIQDAYMEATKEEILSLARAYLNPGQLQVFIVADETTRIKASDGSETTLEHALKTLAEKLALPFREIPLR
ncbi:MAG: insulinase family protein [Deltaproteobacteria bacterium]|nr:insulinase family protein [Deltaproteobacteria bacterium]